MKLHLRVAMAALIATSGCGAAAGSALGVSHLAPRGTCDTRCLGARRPRAGHAAASTSPRATPAELRRRLLAHDIEAAHQLAEALGDDAVPVAIELLASGDGETRVDAFDAIYASGGDETSAPLVARAVVRLGLLADPVPAVRSYALRIVGMHPPPGAVPALLAQLNAPGELADRVVWALGRQRDGAAIRPLLAQTERTPEGRLKRSLRAALAALGVPGFRAELLARLRAHGAAARFEAMQDLEATGDAGLLADAADLFDDRSPLVDVAPAACPGPAAPEWLRACDVLVNVTAEIVHCCLPFDARERRRFSDAEIAAVRALLRP